MIGVVLKSCLMLDLGETFSKASLGYFEYPDTICPPRLGKDLEDRLSLDKLDGFQILEIIRSAKVYHQET